jgi:hypothetical protein
VHALLTEFLSAIRSASSTDDLLLALRELVNQLMVIPGVKNGPADTDPRGRRHLLRRSGLGEAGHAAD